MLTALTCHRILAGHMDGSLHLIGHDGKLRHTVQAHSRPVGVMKCFADKVITGGYDAVVQVHHVLDLSPLFSVQLHAGSISSLCVDQVGSIDHMMVGHMIVSMITGHMIGCKHDHMIVSMVT